MGFRFLREELLSYSGLEIPIQLYHDDDSGSEPLFKIQFNYMNCDVMDFFYHGESETFSLARTYCRIIDKHGQDGARQFYRCRDKLGEFRRKYIVIDNKVYRYTKHEIENVYHMNIVMADGQNINGHSFINDDPYIKDKHYYSSSKTLENLRDKAQKYFNQKKTLPKDEYFMEDKTKEFSELLTEYNELIK